MKATRRLAALAMALTLTVPFTGCGDPPNSPSTNVIVQLNIVGPDSVPPGETRRFTATARLSDGSTRDVSSQAVWRSSNDTILRMASSGEAAGLERGEAAISAVFERQTATKTSVMVLPPGTFKLTGAVRFGQSPVAGAEVTVIGGQGTGLTATTNTDDGQYRLYGVAGEIDIWITSEGFTDAIQHLVVQEHKSADFQLSSEAGPELAAGTYTLTITAADACTELPEPLRVRSYRAVITQERERVLVHLSGAEFVQGLTRFGGVAHPTRLVFVLAPAFGGDYMFYAPEVFEVLPSEPPTRLAITGTATATAVDDGYSGTLNGTLQTVTGIDPSASCRSPTHRFVLTR